MASSWRCSMGLVALVLLLATQSCQALFEDQVGMYDWHQQYIGRVKLAEFQTAGQRKRVYVATEQNVVAALNLRTGQIAWRHALGVNEPIEAIHVHSKYLVSLSGGGRMLRAWSLADGVLVWDATLMPPSEPSPDTATDFHSISTSGDSTSPQDVVVLSGGVVYRLSGSSGGGVLWQTENAATRLYVTESVIYAVSVTDATAGAASEIAVTEIDAASGSASEKTTVLAPVALSTADLILRDGVLVTLDLAGSKIYTAKIDEQPLKLVGTQVASLVEGGANGVAALLSAKLNGAFGLATGGSVAVVRVEKDGGLKPLTEIKGPAVLSDELVTEGDQSVLGVVSHTGEKQGQEIVLKVMAPDGTGNESSRETVELAAHRGNVEQVYLNAYSRKGGAYGFRFLVVGEDDSLTLLQQGEVVWVREEALASVVDVKMVELPKGKEGVTAEAVEHSLEEWFKAHWMRAKATLMLATPEERSLVQHMRLNSAAKNAPTRDHNGFRKLILVLTQSGKILALHTGDGRIMWSLLVDALRANGARAGVSGAATGVEPVALQLSISQDPHRQLPDQAPEVVILGKVGTGENSPGLVATVNGHTGRELKSSRLAFSVRLTIQLPVSDSNGRRLLLLVDDSAQPLAHVFPANQEALDLFRRHLSHVYFYLVDKPAGTIIGYAIAGQGKLAGGTEVEGHVFETLELWKVVFPAETEAIAAVASRRNDESVYTQTKARGRDVVYKYLNKNMLFVATVAPPKAAPLGPVTPEEASLVAYVLDSVTGRVLHRVTHPTMQGPVHAVMSENWVVYHYFNLRSHRYEMSVMELYDDSERAGASDIAKYAFGLGGGNLTAPLSSWAVPPVRVQGQSYFFSYSLRTMTVTSTSMGITTKQLLLGTIGDQVLAMDKRFLDPRRSPTPTQQEREEGVMPYVDILPINTQAYLTHGLPVEGLRGIATEPSRLESTTLIFAYGIDLFYIRHAPSKMYDTLSEDFSYVLLLVTIVALVVAIGVTWVLAERRDLQMRWK